MTADDALLLMSMDITVNSADAAMMRHSSIATVSYTHLDVYKRRVLYFTGVHSFAMLIVLLLIFGLGNGAYWLIIYPIVYDLAELYEYKYGKRKEGALMSLYGVIFTLSTALGTQVLMLTMTAAGYDPSLTVQSEGTVSGISAIVIGIPVIVFILAAICCICLLYTSRCV